MNVKEITSQILKGTSIGGKSYAFDDAHDTNLPAQMWFQRSQEGDTLFIVFYSQACRWSRCLGCNLPSKMSSKHVGYKALMAQIDHVFADPRVTAARESIRKVIVSNNGSVLDQATFSSTALMYLLARLNLHFVEHVRPFHRNPGPNTLTLQSLSSSAGRWPKGRRGLISRSPSGSRLLTTTSAITSLKKGFPCRPSHVR